MTKPIITVFGGSTPRPGDADYLVAEAVGRGLARYGFGIATGGYMGTMEAVSRGAAESGGLVIGVTCNQIETWRQAGPNQWVQREIRVETVRERILRLIDISTGLIALPGGIGTLAEVALSWSFLQTG
ncbi:MAG: DNA-binding protein, partial [Anaerolineae bacterium]|nr:DNA-binding protein [Anaerolineae bacterium]